MKGLWKVCLPKDMEGSRFGCPGRPGRATASPAGPPSSRQGAIASTVCLACVLLQPGILPWNPRHEIALQLSSYV